MNRSRQLMLAAVACFGLLPVGACSRTSDGTVIMPQPPITLPKPNWSFWKKQPEQPAYAAAQFPAVPAPTGLAEQPAAKPAYKSKPLFRAPMMTLDGKGDLNCEDVKQPSTGRVSVVCK